MPIWPLFVVLAVGLVLVVAIATGRWLFPDTRLFTRVVRCPVREHDVVVEFVERVWDGVPVDVTRCSVFTPPTAIDCDKRCRQVRRKARSRLAPAGSA
jgi:hypothetical protein